MPNLDRDLGPNILDQRHTFVGSIVAQPQFERGGIAGAILNNNLFGVAIQLASGIPVNLRSSRELNNDGIASDRPLGVARNSLRCPRATTSTCATRACSRSGRHGGGSHRRSEERLQHRAGVGRQRDGDDQRAGRADRRRCRRRATSCRRPAATSSASSSSVSSLFSRSVHDRTRRHEGRRCIRLVCLVPLCPCFCWGLAMRRVLLVVAVFIAAARRIPPRSINCAGCGAEG